MTEERKQELKQLLSQVIPYLPEIYPRYNDINTWIITIPPKKIPSVHKEHPLYNLITFVKVELSKYIDTDNRIYMSDFSVFPSYWCSEPCAQLLRIAKLHGIQHAITEFDRCLTSNTESIQYYTLLKGIKIDREVIPFDGIRLIPVPHNNSKWSNQLWSNIPESIAKEKGRKGLYDFRNRGVTLAVTDFTVSPIFCKPSSVDESIRQTCLKVKKRKLNEYSINDFFKSFCLGLSLTMNGNVQVSTHWNFLEPSKFTNIRGVAISEPKNFSLDLGIPTNTFTSVQIEEFEHVFDLLYSGMPKNFLNRAVNRFLKSHLNKDPVDKMIDLRIAFEALYLGDGNKGEAKFRLSTRAAWHLGKDVPQRKKLYKFFRTFYDQSSSSVHSENIKDKEIGKMGYNREEFITKSQDLCRKAILKFLKSENIPAKDEWSDYWSNIIMGGGETFKKV